MSHVQILGRSYHTSDQRKAPSFSGNLADNIFSKKLLKSPLPDGWTTSDVQAKYDTYNEYTLNSYNCRGPEFTSNVDFIFAGCSQTFGIGVPDDGVWPKFVAEALDGTYVNLSMLGAGMEWITDSIYRYVHTFGKPKRGIIVLAPDMYRVDQMVNNVLNSCPSPSISDYVPQYYSDSAKDIRLITYHLKHKDPVSFLKKPFPLEDTVIEEESIRRTVKAIKDLEIFCAQSGIPLIWGTWSGVLDALASTLPEEYRFSDYTPVCKDRWQSRPHVTDIIQDYIEDADGVEVTCHSEQASHYGLAFYTGTDRFKFNDGQSHIGVHKHIHIADEFTRRALDMGI